MAVALQRTQVQQISSRSCCLARLRMWERGVDPDDGSDVCIAVEGKPGNHRTVGVEGTPATAQRQGGEPSIGMYIYYVPGASFLNDLVPIRAGTQHTERAERRPAAHPHHRYATPYGSMRTPSVGRNPHAGEAGGSRPAAPAAIGVARSYLCAHGLTGQRSLGLPARFRRPSDPDC